MKVLWLESCRNAHAMQRAWWLILNEQRGLVDAVSGKLAVTQSQSVTERYQISIASDPLQLFQSLLVYNLVSRILQSLVPLLTNIITNDA
jgi:hypothetical protein